MSNISCLCFEDMDVELRHLRAFVTVARRRSYTQAATELLITQPALSRTIQQLESILRVRLLERSTHHVELTEAGERFLLRAERVLGELEGALSMISSQPTLKLGFGWLLPDPWARRTISEFEKTTGAWVSLVRCDDPPASLRRTVVDVAVVRGDADLGGANELYLFDESRVAAVSTLSSLADRDELDWSEFRRWRLVVNTVSGTTNPESWPRDHAPLEVVTCTNYDEWLESVAANHGIGVVPSVAARRSRHAGIRFVPIAGAPPVPVRLAYLGHGSQPLIRAFLEAAANNAEAQ